MHKKPSRKLKLIVIAVAVITLSLVAHGLFVNRLYQVGSELETASIDISDIEADLNDLGSPDALRIQLAKATKDLELLMAQFPANRSVPATMESFIGLAENHDLTVVSARSQPGENIVSGEHTYLNLQIDVELQGNESALFSFLSDVEEGAMSAATVEELSVSTLEESSLVSDQLLKADLTVSMFSRGLAFESNQALKDNSQ